MTRPAHVEVTTSQYDSAELAALPDAHCRLCCWTSFSQPERTMADWNPSLYLQFGAERTRPAAELLARIAHHPVTLAVDLGCGPGNAGRGLTKVAELWVR